MPETMRKGGLRVLVHAHVLDKVVRHERQCSRTVVGCCSTGIALLGDDRGEIEIVENEDRRPVRLNITHDIVHTDIAVENIGVVAEVVHTCAMFSDGICRDAQRTHNPTFLRPFAEDTRGVPREQLAVACTSCIRERVGSDYRRVDRLEDGIPFAVRL